MQMPINDIRLGALRITHSRPGGSAQGVKTQGDGADEEQQTNTVVRHWHILPTHCVALPRRLLSNCGPRKRRINMSCLAVMQYKDYGEMSMFLFRNQQLIG